MTSENVIKVSFEPQQDPKVEMFAVLPENLPAVIDDARRFYSDVHCAPGQCRRRSHHPRPI